MEKEKPAQEDDEEWMFLTQMEPTDMELCSQTEQFEEENGEELFLTQRDPIDMDIDTDSESDTQGQPWHLNLFRILLVEMMIIVREAWHVTYVSEKAKPSTTKIYTPSSRSASLVLKWKKELSLLLLRMLRKRRFPDCPQQCHLKNISTSPSSTTPKATSFTTRSTCSQVGH